MFITFAAIARAQMVSTNYHVERSYYVRLERSVEKKFPLHLRDLDESVQEPIFELAVVSGGIAARGRARRSVE